MRLLTRLRCDEGGFALVLALGVLLALSVSATSVALYTAQNSGAASRSLAEQQALALAEAGMNNARSVLFASPNPLSPSTVPQQTVTYEAGTATHAGTLAGSTWTLRGTGSVRNPNGGPPVTRTVSSLVTVSSGQQSSPNNAVWNYLYSDTAPGGGCMQLSNSVVIDIPLYVRGDLCLSNSARITGQYVKVGGTLTLNNSASVGTAGTSITEAEIVGGCRLSGGAFQSPCSAAQRVYATTIGTSPGGLVKPTVDLAGWYANANPGPLHACTSGSFPGGFDNDGVLNRSRGTIDLLPGSPYDCRVTDPVSGALIGRITWTPGLGVLPGTLLVAGTLFFDGTLDMSNNDYAVYQGRATIYASGAVSMSNNARLCGVAACDATWDASANLLALVAGSPSDAGFVMSNNSKLQGAAYAVNDFLESNNATVWGPIIARQLSIANSGLNHYVPLGTLLPGMPADYEQVTVLQNVPGGFGE